MPTARRQSQLRFCRRRCATAQRQRNSLRPGRVLVVDQSFVPPDAAAVKQQFKTWLITGSAAVLTALAVGFAMAKMRHFRGDGEAGARVWFYDQSAQRLYSAPRDLIPPDGHDDTRVRAMVIGFQGLGNDVSQLKIAYLEKYSPEFKALLEKAEAAHAARRPFGDKVPSQNSAYFQDNTLVKRPGEASWHAIGAEEARKMMAEWREWRGPAGEPPVISVPSWQ